MIREIYLNPEAILLNKKSNYLTIIIKNKKYIMSGTKIEKYFINCFKYYISPISIFSLINIIKENVQNINMDDLYEVLNLLFNNRIIIDHMVEQSLGNEHILIIDYTNTITDDCPENNIIKQMAEEKYGLKIIIIKENSLQDFSKKHLNNFKISVPIFWSWSEIYVDLLKILKQNFIFTLPVILNDNCFSIGPRIDKKMIVHWMTFFIQLE